MTRSIITFILAIFLAGSLLSASCKKEKELRDPCERIFDDWSKCVSSEAIQIEEKLSRASFIEACKKSTEDKNELPSRCMEKSNCAMLEQCVKGMIVVDLFRGASDALAPSQEDQAPKPKRNLGDFAE